MAYTLGKLMAREGEAPYTAHERLCVIAIVKHMSFDTELGEYNCFVGYDRIARMTGCSLSTVKRAVRHHCDGPLPLLKRTSPRRTRGYKHNCYRYSLVMKPEAFAAARDAARSAVIDDVEEQLRDLQPERIELQLQRRDFGGDLSDAEYKQELSNLEKPARKNVPARILGSQRPTKTAPKSPGPNGRRKGKQHPRRSQ